jgi:glycosyltransferase involved in cell wall biosynthesis
LNVSIVIPTRNRRAEVENLLTNILSQTFKPQEIIMVDDSKNDETYLLSDKVQARFGELGINLVHIYGDNNGISAARNKGMDMARSEIVLFVDDDVTLDKNYIHQIFEVYKKDTNVKGVTGYLRSNKISLGLGNAINKVFQALMYKEEGKALVLSTGALTYPYNLMRTSLCEWMSGTNSSYKHTVLDKIRWDENLKSYSLYDDVDLSLRVRDAFPNSLYITPYAVCSHNPSKNARRDLKADAYIRTAYPIYFFYKNMPQTFLNRIRFVYSQLGRSILLILSTRKIIYIKYIIIAHIKTLQNLQRICFGNLDPS